MKAHPLSLLTLSIGLALTAQASQAVESDALSNPALTISQDVAAVDAVELNTSHVKPSSLTRNVAPLATAGRVEIKEQGDQKATVLKGWADAVPLSVALAQVVPSDWKVDKPGIDDSKIVSWKGEREWTLVLEDLAKLGGTDILVDWSSKTLYLMNPGQLDVLAKIEKEQAALAEAARQAKLAKEAAQASEKIEEPASPVEVLADQKAESKEPALLPQVTLGDVASPGALPGPLQDPVVRVELSWEVDPTKTLRENVEEWAKRENWIVVWEGADYPIYSRAVFKGDFTSPTGPIAELIGAYDHSEQPLRVVLKGRSRVVHVTNRNYSATTVEASDAVSMAPRAFMQNESKGE